jgi:hypothetical protein
MNEITEVKDLKVGDEIVVDVPPNYDEGKILNTQDGEILANMVSPYWASTGVRRIQPDHIISLKRGKDYFKVSIKKQQ